MARMRAAKKSPAMPARTAAVRTNLPAVLAPSAKKRPPLHKRGEKRALAGAVVFIVALVITGIIYSGMSTGPPEPEQQTTQESPAGMRIARILLPGTGSTCREILFDNSTGLFSLEKAVPCDAKAPAQARAGNANGSNGGFSSFKEAFGRKS